MKKLLVRILTFIMALTSIFAISLFAGCDCGGSGDPDNVIPKPDDGKELFLTLDSSELNLIVGDESKLTASYIKEEGKTLTFTVADASIASIDEKGNVVANNKGSTKITATYGDLTAECAVNVTFGNYLPELSFEGGVLDTYYVGLDGKVFEFNPIIKFNGKTFTDVEAEYSVADSTIATFENGNGLKGLKLGTTIATIKASWRGFTIETCPALQKEVNVQTKNVANFLINDDIVNTLEISTFNGVFGGVSYANTSNFIVKVEYNGAILEEANVTANLLDTNVATLENNVITSKLRGNTVIKLEYTDALGEKFTHEVNVVVSRPVAESNKYFKYFSAGIGYYKIPENNWENKSIIDEVFGSDASKVIDAFTEDGETLRVKGNRVLDVPGFASSAIDNVIIVGTDTYAYKIKVETYGAIISEKEDLASFSVDYRYSEEDFEKAADKVKYLQDMKAKPFTFVDGYCILVNDIDASGFVFNHEAIIPLEVSTETPAYEAVNNVFVEREGVSANIEYNGVSYAIPRKGYPILRVDNLVHAPIGFRGLFDGQGFKIYNANVQRNNNEVVKGVGFFGAIANGAIIRNVAFVDINAQHSTALAYHIIGFNIAGAYIDPTRPTIENVYIKLSDETTNPYGLFGNDGKTSPTLNKYGSYRIAVVNVIVDATSIPDTVQYGLFSSGGIRQENNSLRGHYTNFFIAVHANNYVNPINLNDLVNNRYGSGNIDIIVAPTMEELFAREDFYKDYSPSKEMEFSTSLATTMAKEFANNPYFEIVGKGVFFKGLAEEQALRFVDGDDKTIKFVSLSVNRTEQELYLMDASGNKITDVAVEISNTDVLEYVNGKIIIKSHVLGTYEVTFTSGDYSKTIVVEIGARIEALKGYVQEDDGELVAVQGLDVSLLDNATYQVNGVVVDGKVENGKVYVGFDGVDLTAVSYMDTVKVLIKTTHEVNFEITATYVTLAIDEAEDLKKFNVGYKFNEQDYNNASNKAEYLAEIAKDPFDYYEGYYVLTKNVDATGIKFSHEAIVVNGNIAFTNTQTEVGGVRKSEFTPIDGVTDALIGGYAIPRPGYGVAANSILSYKVGFRGVFDGQGYVISNLDSTREGDVGAGLFGTIVAGSEITNVAFDNLYLNNSAGLAYYVTANAGYGGEFIPTSYPYLKNVYIKTANNIGKSLGVITNNTAHRVYMKNVFLNALSVKETDGIYVAAAKTGANAGISLASENFFVVCREDNVLYTTPYNEKRVNRADSDLVMATSLEALYTKDDFRVLPGIDAEGNPTYELTTMAKEFAENPYFVVIEKGVFWKGLTSEAFGFVDGDGNKLTSVDLDKVITEQEIYLVDATGTKLNGVQVELSNTSVLEYVNGKIKVKSNVIGTYEATFKYGEYSKTIVVEIGAEVIALEGGYLQGANGELVQVEGVDFDLLDGATYVVNGINTTAEVEDETIFVDLEGVDLSQVKYESIVNVVIKTTTGINYNISTTYVTLAIDEAEDLQYFNVGYKFNQVEYNALSTDAEKEAYLAKMEANPYDYYDGYYILLKDIDATGITFNHEAAIYLNYADGYHPEFTSGNNSYSDNTPQVGFGVVDYKLVANNALAQDYNGDGNVDATEAKYFIPRDGYPLLTGIKFSNTQFYYVPGATIVRMGFFGTFDGKGHVISNLNAVRNTTITYKEGTEVSTFNGYGAGIFGVLNINSAIKNVALTNFDASNSSAFAISAINVAGNVDYAFDEKEIFYGKPNNKTLFENIYIDVTSNVISVGTTHSFSNSVGVNFRNIFIDATKVSTAVQLYAGQNETAYLGGSRNHNSKSAAGYFASNVYVATKTDVSFIMETYSDTNTKHMDVTRATGLEGIYSATTNMLGTEKTMAGSFAENEYFEVIGNCVYWKGLANNALTIVDGEGNVVPNVVFNPTTTEQEVYLADAIGTKLEGVEIEISNTDVLEYVDGKIKVKSNVIGNYEVTFKYGKYSKTIAVEIIARVVELNGYLQEVDGELVEVKGLDLEVLDGATYQVNGVNVEGKLENGKVSVELGGVDLSTTNYLDNVTVLIKTNHEVNFEITAKYVTLAIDEASDLNHFNVGYRFDQAEYESASDKTAYLQDVAAKPFDYYDGYYILLKDIDATGITFNHEALLVLDGDTETPAFTVGADAFVPESGVENALINGYAIPREGYAVNRVDSLLFAPIGFRGTFDGQGHIISNANTVRNTEDVCHGVGIFGAIANGAVIKNVAFVDLDFQNSTGLAYYLVGGNTEGEYIANVRPKFENIYIKIAKTSYYPFGLFANDGASSKTSAKNGFNRFAFENVVVDASAIATAVQPGIFSSASVNNKNNSLRSTYVNFFIAIHENNYSSQANLVGFIDERYASGTADIITAPTMEELFARNDFYATYSPTVNMEFDATQATTMAKEFANNPYFEIVGNGVYWKGLATNALTFVDGEGEGVSNVTLNPTTTEQEVYLADITGAKLEGVEVEISNTDVLEYVDGKIKVKSNVIGNYEVTFKYGKYSKTIAVEVTARVVELKGYLQEDGELVEVKGLDLEVLDGATYQVNGVNVEGKLENGKVSVELDGVDLSTTNYLNEVNVLIKTTQALNYQIDAKYVTVAIDEASDLLVFNVGYKFNQADYEAASDKDAYLAKIAADPFDYAEGYYVLTKDIDATGIVFNHEAIMPYDDAGVTFAITASAGGFTDAGLVSGATIGGYVIPREGFPVMVATVSHVKVGFRGTFDGQGHTLSNVDSTRETTLETKGMGLFGAITNGAVIKNVAFVDIHCDNTVGFAYALVGGNTSGAVYENVRPKYENVYVKVADNGYKTVISHGLFANSGYANKTTYKNGDYRFKFIDVVVDATTIYNDSWCILIFSFSITITIV